MIELAALGFMEKAYVSGIMISIITSILGLFLVLRKLSLIGDGLAHASFGGIAIGLLLNINPMLTALVVSTIGSLGIHKLMSKAKAYGDSAIAVILSAGMAIAITIIGYVKGFDVDLFSYLFGSILTTSNTDILIIAAVFISVLIYLKVFYKELVYLSFNKELAALNTNKSKLSEKIFIVLIALAVIVAIKAVGILLVTALIVIPPLTALQISNSFKESLFLSCSVSITSMLGGIHLAYLWNLPPSGVIVLTMLGFFLFSILYDELS